MIKIKQFLDSFDVEFVDQPLLGRMTPDQRDVEILKHAKRVSIFWVTDSFRRAKLVSKLIDSKQLVLDKSCGYPCFSVEYF